MLSGENESREKESEGTNTMMEEEEAKRRKKKEETRNKGARKERKMKGDILELLDNQTQIQLHHTLSLIMTAF